MRIGHGYDVHQLVEGRKLILGGAEIPFEKGLLGHSDADVLIHAIIDALLGACACGDIGTLFPDSSPSWKDIASTKLLQLTYTRITDAGYAFVNLDATIIAQRPKLAPYIPLMRDNIASILHTPLDTISVKATTEEHLGFTGRGEGISAHAVCLLRKI